MIFLHWHFLLMVLPAIGGFNSNQLLKYLDYDLIKNNPKILGCYSDITALQNAIFAKTGLVTYSGHAFSTFAMKKGFDYIEIYFKKCLMEKEELKDIPVIADVDFGHSYPMITFPIGGRVMISAEEDITKIRILEH